MLIKYLIDVTSLTNEVNTIGLNSYIISSIALISLSNTFTLMTMMMMIKLIEFFFI